MAVTSINVRQYLGMTIDFYDKSKLKFNISDNISNILEELPEDINTQESATTYVNYMLMINEYDLDNMNQ